MRPLHCPARFTALAISLCPMLAGICLTSPAMAATGVDGRTKSALKTAILTAPSGAFLSPATVEQRVEVGLIYLRAQGYYGATIDIIDDPQIPQENGREDFTIALETDARLLRVRPGPLFIFAATAIDVEGPSSSTFDAARAKANALLSNLGGQPARSADVLRVQSQALATLKEAGFTSAQDTYPDILVDHETSTMAVTYKIASGPLTLLGAPIIVGAQLTPQTWVARTADITKGDPATGDVLRKTAERLRLTGAYQNVELSLEPVTAITAQTQVADVRLVVAERTKRIWSAGAIWSTTDGLGVDASTSFFHRFHRADTLNLGGKIGTLESSLGASLLLPSLNGPSRDLFIEARAGQETTDAFERLIARIGATYSLPRGRRDLLSYGVGIDITRTRTPTQTKSTLRRDVDGADLGLLIRYERDRTDDIINPTKGWRAQGELQPNVFLSTGETIPYARLEVAGSYYQPFSALRDGVFATRLKAGVLISGNDQLPFDRRFFAGGGGSVRGYGYQSIGPRDAFDNPIGGRSLIEGTVEARWSLRGPFGLAVFADAARVGALTNGDEQQTKVGIGIGLRYNLGFAPLRIDLAVPLNKREGEAPVQIYLSAGQSF